MLLTFYFSLVNITFVFYINCFKRAYIAPPPKKKNRTSFDWTSNAWKGPSPVYERKRIKGTAILKLRNITIISFA